MGFKSGTNRPGLCEVDFWVSRFAIEKWIRGLCFVFCGRGDCKGEQRGRWRTHVCCHNRMQVLVGDGKRQRCKGVTWNIGTKMYADEARDGNKGVDE